MNLSVEPQETDNACGAAVVASGLGYWSVAVKQQEILQRYKPASEYGYSLKELRQIFQEHKLTAIVIAGTADVLEKEIQKGRPVIVAAKLPVSLFMSPYTRTFTPGSFIAREISPESNHFVVITGFSEKEFLVADPARGLATVNRELFLKYWEKVGRATLVFGRLSG